MPRGFRHAKLVKKPEPVEPRFWAKVAKSDGCWLWTGARVTSGHAQMSVNGRSVSVHRVSWTIHNGEIPEGRWVLHRCDNPACVNPDHLYLGDASDNSKDKYVHETGSRHADPTRRPRVLDAKLTPGQVGQIRTRAASGESQRTLAEEFGVNQSTVSRIATNKRWRRKDGA